MGRAKLKMESLTNENKRNLAFNNKKAGLIKKMHELTVLCDVKACMIIYYGSKDEPHIWPENHDEVRGLVDAYKNKDQLGRNKTYGLSDFFKDKKRKVEQDIAKLRKETLEVKYPAWHESLDKLTGPELRRFAEGLGEKAALLKSRIDLLKSNAVERFMGQGQGQGMDQLMNFGDPRIDWSLVNRQQGIPFQPNETPYGYYPIPMPFVNGQNGVSFVNQNSMMNMLMNGTNDGGECGSGFTEPVNLGNPDSIGWFNGQSMQPMPMQFPTYMQPQRQQQQQFPSAESYFVCQDDNFRY